MTFEEMRKQIPKADVSEGVIEMYSCGACENLFNDESSARDCCGPRKVFICGICGKDNSQQFWTHREAEDHIIDQHNSLELAEEALENEYREALYNGFRGGRAMFDFERNLAQ